METVTYWIPDETMPYKFNTSGGKSKKSVGKSKKYEWMQVAGVPCITMKFDGDTITLNSFTSAEIRKFDVDANYFQTHFTQIYPDPNGDLHLEKYPLPVNIREFDLRKKVTALTQKVQKIHKNKKISEPVRKVFDDKFQQMLSAQGCPHTVKLDDYEKFKSGKLSLTAHKRIGDPICNRSTRWMPPVDITYEEFSKSKSFPAPLGIRPKDFCLPSELIVTVTELVTQVMNFANVSEEDFIQVKMIFNEIERKCSACKYCGEKIDINAYSSAYKSSDNFIEICHRDPQERFIQKNMYWGHGECNRRQGGYSEKDRIEDGLRLMFISGKLTDEERANFKDCLSRLGL